MPFWTSKLTLFHRIRVPSDSWLSPQTNIFNGVISMSCQLIHIFSSSQTNQSGVRCGRPSLRTVVIQISFCRPSRASSARQRTGLRRLMMLVSAQINTLRNTSKVTVGTRTLYSRHAVYAEANCNSRQITSFTIKR